MTISMVFLSLFKYVLGYYLEQATNTPEIRHQTGWSKGNALGLYLEGVRFNLG
jgi:hypothetical protein